MISQGTRLIFRKYGQDGTTVTIGGLPKDGSYKVEDCLGRDVTAWVRERQALGDRKLGQIIKVMNFIDRVSTAQRLFLDSQKMFKNDQLVEDLTCAFLNFKEIGEKYIKQNEHLRADRTKGGVYDDK
jgi:hypothetical protein